MQTVIACVITAVVALIIGIPIGIQIRKRTAEKEINSAEEEAKRIINESIKSAESKKREALVEAKEEILQARNEYEREVKERRADLQKQERRLQQKEENLDRKTENIEKKEDTLQRKLAELDEARDEVATVKKTQMEVLERISGFTAEEAKNYLINQLAEEVTHESAMKVREIEAQFKEEADTRAKEILSLAIQRCAADHVAEATVSVVPLPNDEMKGRIIGREGRNIRTLETMTGVDLIIDDTPEAITVSCFDPVRREIARIALEKLIQDGRIHPTRIEEMVEKAKREVDATIKAEGERAVFETNVHGLHPELIKLLGRMRYRTSYGQNVLNHSIEVSPLAGLTVYRSASADTMQSLYVANPALAGGVLGGLFFALLTLCDCARTSRCRVEVLCDAAVSPLTAALARLMALLGTAALTLALTLLTWLPWTAHTVGAGFDGGDYLLAYLILMGLALPLCILLAGAAWQFTRRFDLSLVLVAALAALSLTIWRDNWQLCWLNPCVWALSDDFSNFRILRSAAYMRLTWRGCGPCPTCASGGTAGAPWALWPARPGGYTAPCWPRPCCSAAAGAVPLSPSSTTATRISAP